MSHARLAVAGLVVGAAVLSAAPASAAPPPPSVVDCARDFAQWFVLYDPGPMLLDPAGWVLGYASGPVALVLCAV